MHQKGKLMCHKPKYLLASLIIGYFLTGIALAAGDEGFYKGKALRLIVAFAPGGGF
jgi:tripartite-type tricarboxylate transporter receptor subunit TctC